MRRWTTDTHYTYHVGAMDQSKAGLSVLLQYLVKISEEKEVDILQIKHARGGWLDDFPAVTSLVYPTKIAARKTLSLGT